MATKRAIAVSDLADYADDPLDHCRRQGQPRNRAAAHRGTQAHDRQTANRSRRPIAWLLGLAVVTYVAYLVSPLWLP